MNQHPGMTTHFFGSADTLIAIFLASLIAATPMLAAAQTTAKKAPVRTAKKATKSKEAPQPPAPLVALGPDELAVAQKVEVGKIDCELGADVTVTADTRDVGYFDLEVKGRKLKMMPVVSRVGAIRLEEVRGGDGMWLQLSNKSMLMRGGNRVADECMSMGQSIVAEGLKKNPAPSLLDAAPAK